MKNIFFVALAVFGTVCVCILFVFSLLDINLTNSYTEEDIKNLDAYELHYDADSYFIVIDKSHNLVGVYYGMHPMEHFYCESKYDGKYLVTSLDKLLGKGIILTSEIYSYLSDCNFPDDTPVVILELDKMM